MHAFIKSMFMAVGILLYAARVMADSPEAKPVDRQSADQEEEIEFYDYHTGVTYRGGLQQLFMYRGPEKATLESERKNQESSQHR